MTIRRRIFINPGEKVSVALTDEEFTILLDRAIAPPNLESALRFRIVEDNQPVARMDLDSVEELAGYVASERNHGVNKKYRRMMDSIWRKLELVLETYTDEENLYDRPHEPIQDSFPAKLVRLWSGDISINDLAPEDLWELGRRIGQPAGDRPIPYLGGLSLRQADLLIYSDWNDPNGPVQINSGLDLKSTMTSELWLSSRLFLQALQEEKRFEATATGNLSRKCVAFLLNAMNIPKDELESLYRFNKVINEMDVRIVHLVRLLLEIGKLIRHEKKSFRLTRRGAAMLKEDQAGELFATLFKVHFRKFNLAYLDQMEDNRPLQDTVGFTLLRISKVFRQWRKADAETIGKILLPEVIDAAPSAFHNDYLLWQTESRILRPLVSFGLLYERKAKEESQFPISQYRLSPLFSRFLGFNLPANPA